ncbi:branched-chain amino acid ABC transporter substrate-binding protein [Xanthobacter oligotrophicus]|uniref:branched-chain amino acid ABC transporter substrate-binding protein n=1 Tax=Xanthobacter oligotrophicus TaxID=2607286 RepID=UPI0011F211E4|nr:branched-chain amino acid ABC transporter substrate-binding protein [Xanthobacter oligotrophicus]MCG5236331.1 branched-chain amino acid ABC transporter substrate-binding protein [Xanthobacter oligotrophicus]
MTIRTHFLAPIAAMLLASTAGAASAEPLKVAVIETLSGPQASTGLLFKTAAKFGIDKINAGGGYGGEPIALLEYDNQGGPVGAADKVKAAIADGARFIVQGSSSAVSGQITEDVRKHNLRNPGKEVLFLNVGGEALELTGAKCHFYHFRFNPNAQVRVKPMVLAMKDAGILGTRVYSMNQNYSWGIDMEGAIVANAPLGGYTVVEKTLHDVNKIQDFSPYVAKISAANAETVITGNWSNDLLLLMKAAHGAGLKTRFATAFLDQPGNIANAGDVALGNVVSHPFNAEASEATAAFSEDYKAKTGHYPVYIEPQTAFGMAMVGEALKSVPPAKDGSVDINAVAKAIENVKVKTPMGEASMRAADHQAQIPMAVSIVAEDAKFKVDGTNLGFKPMKLFTAAEASSPVQDACKMTRPN